MPMRKLALRVLTAVLTIAVTGITVVRLNAQAATASIQGTVTNTSGAAIPGTTV